MLVSRGGATVRRRAVLGALALGAVVLSGCQANPEPPPIDTASSSPSPSPSPTDAAPTLPAEAQGTSEKAAKAFVRHYIDLVNFAMRTGDVHALSTLSDPGCTSCAEVIRNIEGLYADGGHLEGEGWEVRTTKVFPLADPRSYAVQASILVHPQTRVIGPGNDERFDGGKKAMTFSVRPAGDGWLVRQWSQA